MREKVYDVNLLHYDWLNQALGEKRFIRKGEIGSKMHIIEAPSCSPLEHHLSLQRVSWTDSFSSSEAERRIDEGYLDAHYFRDVFGEPHLNEVLVEYCSKVMLSGYTVPLVH
jgi:hypothetical protein